MERENHMTMMNTVLDQINRMDASEINRVVEAIKSRRSSLSYATNATLRIGDIVSWMHRDGRTATGSVKKVNKKTVIVDERNGPIWKVSASMLTPLSIGG
tara:strand:+ start:596 stop:895 length:300 start_codon:yes stop_codon:yes gene_type:complete